MLMVGNSHPSSLSSSSSSDFEFAVSISPTTKKPSGYFCPADELFCKGQLLPLQAYPRHDTVRTLLQATSSSSSSNTNTTDSRDSSGSSTDCSSAGDFHLLKDDVFEYSSNRPSSATHDDDQEQFRKSTHQIKRSRYFPISSFFSSVFHRKDEANPPLPQSDKRIGASARDAIKKCVQKMKPLYVKLSALKSRWRQDQSASINVAANSENMEGRSTRMWSVNGGLMDCSINSSSMPHRLSFSGNLSYMTSYPKHNKSGGLSCPSSMSSSPNNSGVLRRGGYYTYQDFSSMEELQSSIQGAIAHCKSSLIGT